MSDAEVLTLKDLIRYYEMEEAIASAIKRKYGSVDNIPQVPEKAISAMEVSWILVGTLIIHPLWLMIVDQLFFDVWSVTEFFIDFYHKYHAGGFGLFMMFICYVGFGSLLLAAIAEAIHQYAQSGLSRSSGISLTFKHELRSLVRDLENRWDKEDRDARYAEIDLESLKRQRQREREEPMRAAWRRINLHKNDWRLAFDEPPETFRTAYFEAEKYNLNPALRIVDCLPSLPH